MIRFCEEQIIGFLKRACGCEFSHHPLSNAKYGKQLMDFYKTLQIHLAETPRTWLVTGVAGFIGCNLLEKLLMLHQHVVGLDSFATGYRRNLDQVHAAVSPAQWANFNFI